MAKHEFGIMQNAPKPGKRYDTYAPRKYGCICVDDDLVAGICADLSHVESYWHTLDRPAKGLAHTGITLIPPTSMPAFTAAINNVAEFAELKDLLEKAQAESKWIIHFGL